MSWSAKLGTALLCGAIYLLYLLYQHAGPQPAILAMLVVLWLSLVGAAHGIKKCIMQTAAYHVSAMQAAIRNAQVLASEDARRRETTTRNHKRG